MNKFCQPQMQESCQPVEHQSIFYGTEMKTELIKKSQFNTLLVLSITSSGNSMISNVVSISGTIPRAKQTTTELDARIEYKSKRFSLKLSMNG